MATIAGMLRKWQAINLTEESKTVLADNAQEVVLLQQEQLYQDGVKGTNEELPGYAYTTAQSGYLEKKGNPRISSAGNPYDLKDTGSFYEGMYLRLNGDTMEIDSSDPKRNLLVAHLGASILRLDTVSKNGLRKNILQPSLVQALAQKTGCGVG